MLGARYAWLTIICLSPTLVAQSHPPLAREIETTPWFARVSEEVRREEYQFRARADEHGVWLAPNRSQDFRCRVSREGLEVFPRQTRADGIGAPWRLQLRTASFGRLGDPRDLGSPLISGKDGRVELDHGVLQEWLENRAAGLEQGWTIPTCQSGVVPLWIGLEFGGDLALRIDAEARSGSLVDANGQVMLRYRDLMAFDATGRELAARLQSSPSGVGIQIDDTGAVYPLTVDPVLTGPAWTGEGDQADAWFGNSVASAGDVNGDGHTDVIIGAPTYDSGQGDEGRAFVYLGSTVGLAANAAWTAEGDQNGAYFGWSVATAGDVNGDGFSDVIVAAPSFENGQTDEGRTFVYLGSPGGLSASSSWTAEGDQASAGFGSAVATAGDMNGDGYSDVIVGASNYDNGQIDEGRAFAYLGSATGLAPSAAWTAESDDAGASFGCAVATAGDVNGDGYGDVIVGAVFYGAAGRALVYMGSAAGLASFPAWIEDGFQTYAYFGNSVATAGDVNGDGLSDVIIGAPGYDNGQAEEGRAFLYLGPLPSYPTWTAEGDQTNAFFGSSVATAGDVNGDGFSDVIIGANGYDNGQSDEGRAVVYLGSTAGLGIGASWTAESDQVGARFGWSVAMAGDVNGDGYTDVIVGTRYYDNGESDEGGAFVYRGSAVGLASMAAWTGENDQADAQHGYAVATAGDVNGDGFSDVIVGAPFYDNGESGEGRVFAYLGAADGLATIAAWTAESDQAGAQFGVSVASAGDVNGDGFSDVIVGAEFYDHGESNEGRAFVFLGSPGGLAASAAWTAESDQASAFLGRCVASAGDVNGDGFGDVIVGAHQYDNGQSNEGRALAYLGSQRGLAINPTWTAESDQADASFGATVASAGDVNADGYSDVLVGALEYDGGQTDEGRTFAYMGSSGGLSISAAWTAEGDQATARFGYSIATAGDVNGDGYSDVIIGAPLYDHGKTDEGRAFAYLGSAGGLATSAAWTAESNQESARFGYSVATAGDVDGDGYSDVIVGAYSYANGQSNEGRAYEYLGSASGLATSAAWTAESDQVNADFGWSVATAGDVNGDGYSDVIVGAPYYDLGQTDEGAAFVYLGNEGRGGWTLAAQQRRSNDAAPIDLLGRCDSPKSFRLELTFDRHLAGFSWASGLTPTARLEWEVASLSVALELSGLDSGADRTITWSPLVFNELVALPLVSIVPAHHSYHWRARLRTSNPLFPVTPWVSIPWNGITEAKLRSWPGAASTK
ncbi:MAG: integrin alpha [Planctomycetota bacterium]